MEKYSPLFSEDAFLTLDDRDDTLFYETDRFVSHLDSLALSTVQNLIGGLIIEENPVILDLMAGWDSHIPDDLKASGVVGLGLNENELKRNKRLTRYVLHNLNLKPYLPFPDNTFDAVLNTVSVDYMTRPIAVFKEVGRILKSGGLFLVIFSNRMFPQKAVKVWRESDENERVILVNDFFDRSGTFERLSRSSTFHRGGRSSQGCEGVGRWQEHIRDGICNGHQKVSQQSKDIHRSASIGLRNPEQDP